MTRLKERNVRNGSRRSLLKAVAAGGGVFTGGAFLPSQWTRPVVDAVLLPAHAQTSLIGCEAVFCNLDFTNEGILGSAEVMDGVLTMLGISQGGDWFGSGPVSPDGSFSIVVQFEDNEPAQVTGLVEEGCIRISGGFDFSEGTVFTFSGSPSSVPSIQDCRVVEP